MGLIKADAAPAAKACAFSMADIEQAARNILLRARAKADQVLSEAQVLGEELKRKAHETGLASGYNEGIDRGVEEGGKLGHQQALEEHRARLTETVGMLNAATGELNARREALEVDLLHDVVALAVKIAERVTKRQGVIDPNVLSANVGEALRLVTGAHDVRIAIHPTQREVLDDAMPRLRLQFPTLGHVEIVADASVAPGGCRVYTRQGLIDADLDAQLRRIASELLPTPGGEA